MNTPLHHVIRPGIVHFMAFPETIKGEGPILETCRQILADDYFGVIEISWIKDPAVRAQVTGTALPPIEPPQGELGQKRGCFVTLTNGGRLRGCIGNIGSAEMPGRELSPLYQTVAMMAVEAAAHDPRFDSVGPEELKDITIEVSVLSRPRQGRGPASIAYSNTPRA